MKKIDSNLSSIVHLSRAQTAKMRQTLTRTLKNIRTRKTKNDIKINSIQKRPKTTSSYFSHRDMQKKNPIYLLTTENNLYNKTTTRTKYSKYSRPNTSYGNPRESQINKVHEKNENHKTHFNEMQILNIFDKQRDKNDDENNDDYIKKIQYKKLIMRAKLLKAMKYNIILKDKQFEEFNQKYSSGNKYLGEKLRNRGKIIKNDSDDDYSDSDSPKAPERPNFNSLKHPDIFSTYEFTSLFQDFHCTPLELIKKIFNSDEQKLINLDPIYFRLNKEPFTGVQKNLRFCLKDKINEEDKILLQKIKQAKERNKRLYYLRKRKKEKSNKKKNTNKDNAIENEKNEKENENENEENMSDNDSNIEKKSSKKEKRTNSVYNKTFGYNWNKKKSNNKNKSFKIKGNNYLGIKVKKMKKKEKEQEKEKDNNLILNLNTDYNVYLETHRSHNRNKSSFSNPILIPIDDEEKISEKKKRLTMQEFFELYNERKKTYLDDLSYNRTKKKYKYEQLRKEHCENIANEHEKKENLRKIMYSIEQNYKHQNHPK